MGKRDVIDTHIFLSGLLTNCYIFVEIKELSKTNHVKNMINQHLYIVKKVSDFPIPTFPTWENLFSDIPAWDGKIANLFFTVW